MRLFWRGLLLAWLLGLCSAPARAVSDPAEMLPNPRQETRAEQIGQQLRCLVCQNESIEASQAGLARDLRRIVRQRVAAGDSDRQVIAWMVARYGDFVRLKPRLSPTTLLLWGSPFLALLTGLLLALMGFRHRAPPPPLTEAERARLHHIEADNSPAPPAGPGP